MSSRIATALLALCAAAGCADDGPTNTYAVIVRGQLASPDLATAQAAHDMIAQGGESSAREQGDFGHSVLLGTTLLDSTHDEFFALDRWTDLDAMKAFYQDPAIAQGFASLFAAPPSVEFFEAEPDWVSWGDVDTARTQAPYYFHLALGDLANADIDAAQVEHDQVASGGKQPSLDAGNVAHLVYLGVDDPHRFLGLDIWQSDDNIEAFYTNPQFVAAFAPLFADVTQPVYQSTDWYQW